MTKPKPKTLPPAPPIVHIEGLEQLCFTLGGVGTTITKELSDLTDAVQALEEVILSLKKANDDT